VTAGGNHSIGFSRCPPAIGILGHNRLVHRLLAVCLLLVFAALSTTDALACPDGCQAAATSSAADHCNATGTCLFCTGGVASVAKVIAVAPLTASWPPQGLPVSQRPLRVAAVPDHPPRLT